jgi:hypothetical protein
MSVRITFTPQEIDLIERNELELFESKFPSVAISRYDAVNSSVHNRLGVRIEEVFKANKMWVNADYDRSRKISELRDGVWVKTNRINVKFCCRQLNDNNFTIKKGDIILFPVFNIDEKYEILSIEFEDFITGTHVPLHASAVIDLDHKWGE